MFYRVDLSEGMLISIRKKPLKHIFISMYNLIVNYNTCLENFDFTNHITVWRPREASKNIYKVNRVVTVQHY